MGPAVGAEDVAAGCHDSGVGEDGTAGEVVAAECVVHLDGGGDGVAQVRVDGVGMRVRGPRRRDEGVVEVKCG